MLKIGTKGTAIIYKGNKQSAKMISMAALSNTGREIKVPQDMDIEPGCIMLHTGTRQTHNDDEWIVEAAFEIVSNTDQWLTNGKCSLCRRADYCKKGCKANKRYTQQQLSAVMSEHPIGKILGGFTNDFK